ncbi:MFS transporter [Rhodococcus koreensis]
MTATPPVTDVAAPPRRGRLIAGALVGNFVEFYDFAVYGLIALPVASHFFPKGDSTAALLSTLLIFAAAFVIRPIGGLFWGALGDRIGRKPTLAATILVMAAGTVAMGVLPVYSNVGIVATVMLVAVRLVQGFAAGGELGGALTFVIESVGPKRRGLANSIVSAGGVWGTAGASLIVGSISTIMGPEAFNAWGWRIALLLAAPLALIGLFIRLRLEEAPAMKKAQAEGRITKESAPLKLVFRDAWRDLLRVWGLMCGVTFAGYFSLGYLFIYASTHLGVKQNTAYWFNVIMITIAVCLMPLWGMLTDRIGRKPVLAGAIGLLIVMPYPILLMMNTRASMLILLGMTFMLCICTAFQAAIYTMMPEMFRTEYRYTGTALGQNIPLLLFGGTSPYISEWIISVTHNSLSPAFLIMAAAVVSLIAWIFVPETFKKDLTK